MNTASLSSYNAIVLAPCAFHLDPRHEYWATKLEEIGFSTLRVEILEECDQLRFRRTAKLANNVLSLASSSKNSYHIVSDVLQTDSIPSVSPLGRFIKNRLHRLLSAVSHDFIMNSNPDVVIANDLLGAVLAVSVWGKSNCKIIYDAQEVFTDSYDLLGGPVFTKDERRTWIDIETKVCKSVNSVVTVSPGISELYRERHGVTCHVLPNFVPRREHRVKESLEFHTPTRFVLVGRADPHRGLEELITTWDVDASIATLELFMPYSTQRERLENLSSKTKRTFSGPIFREPVKPDQIITTLTSFDVGILPYNYPYPYSHASPNKFGEYIAAGLVVLANDQPFVSEQISNHGLGHVFDWKNKKEFLEKVKILSKEVELRNLSENVQNAATQAINWDSASPELWQLLQTFKKIEVGRHFLHDSGPPSNLEYLEMSSLFERAAWILRRQIIAIGMKSLGFIQLFTRRNSPI